MSRPTTDRTTNPLAGGTTDAGPEVPRRQMLCGLLLVGLLGPAGAAVVTGCADSTDSSDPAGTDTGNGRASARPSGGAGGESGALANVSDIPVGGGKLVTAGDRAVLLVQPTAGTVVGYDPRCTHAGTRVDTPVEGVMTCPNHGSQFKAVDGSVVQGPAKRPLAKVDVVVTDGKVRLA